MIPSIAADSAGRNQSLLTPCLVRRIDIPYYPPPAFHLRGQFGGAVCVSAVLVVWYR